MPCVAVAYSGGRDSTALVHCTLHIAAQCGIDVVALHVHHGLHADADAWLAHAQAQCERWARRGLPVRFVHRRLAERPARGESVEAWARKARYRALGAMAREAGATLVLLAHHRTDQAETFLVQALRGAGAAGLSAMPRIAQRDGLTWARPWLDAPRARIEAYVRAHRLRYVDDASNIDERFARNRLRASVWPALAAAFPDAEATLAAAAVKAQQAQDALDELAALDLVSVQHAGALQRAPWLALSSARRVNVLRAWLLALRLPPGATLLQRVQREWPAAASSARWSIADGALRHYRGALHFVPARAQDEMQAAMLCIRRAGRIPLPAWGGTLVAQRVREGGVALARLARCELRARTGGERFQAAPRSTARALKKQYQAAGVPEWERDGPLVYCGGELVFVSGLGIDARLHAQPGEPQVSLRWERSP